MILFGRFSKCFSTELVEKLHTDDILEVFEDCFFLPLINLFADEGASGFYFVVFFGNFSKEAEDLVLGF